MNFDEFMLIFGRESDTDDIEDAEVVEPAEGVAEADTAEDADVVTTTDNNNSADLNGDDDSNAFLTDEAPEEHDEADVDMDPSADILEEIADSDEDGFDKQMKIPTVSDDETVFDTLQDQTDVQVHNIASKEQEILDKVDSELNELLSNSGDMWDEKELDAIPDNQDAEKVGGVDPINPGEHEVTNMLNDRIENIEQNHMLNVSTKDKNFDADDFLAEELNGETPEAEGECDAPAEPAEAPVDDVAAVTEDEEADVVPEGAEPEDEEVEAEDTEEAPEADEASEEPAEDPVDTSEVEITGDEVPAEDGDDESGDAEDGNIFDDPETFEITGDVVEKQRMAEYTFKPTVSPDEHDSSAIDPETVVRNDDVQTQEVEGAADEESGDVEAEAEGDMDVEAPEDEPADDVETDEAEETPAEDAEEEVAEDEAPAEEEELEAAKESEDEDVVPEGAEPEVEETPEEEPADEEAEEVEDTEAEAEVDETPVDADAEVTPDAPTADPEGDSDVETISACIRNDLESDPENLYKEEEGVITVGDDPSALDNASGVVEEGDGEPAENNEQDDPSEYNDIEDVDIGSQDLSDVLDSLLDEPHEIESDGGDEVSEEAPEEAEVAEEPTEDAEPVETAEETDVETDEVGEADEAIESLFANLNGFRL